MPMAGSAKKGTSQGYLIQLQEKNRLLKKLQHKSSGQRMLEQREQGFSLYLNGANASLQVPVRVRTRKFTSDKQKRNTKTAGSDRVNGSHGNQADSQYGDRAKTAPMKERLKWGSHSCDVTAVDGEVVHISAPDSKFTGNYEDDFEVTMGMSSRDNPASIQMDLSTDNTKVLREALQEAIGDQDDDMNNCSDDSIGCCSDDSDSDDVPIPLYSASVSKATQSLSAVQRKRPTVVAEGSGISNDVLLALQLENDAIGHTSTVQPHPPATPSTAKTIEIVTEQVKLMNFRQQRKLLRFLEKLEQLPSPPLTPAGCLHTTDSQLHSHSVDLLTSQPKKKSLITKKQLPSSAGTQRRTSFDWLNNDNKIQRSQSVSKLSNVIGLEEEQGPSSRIPSGRTSGLRGLLSGGRQLEDTNDNKLQAKSEMHLPTFLDDPTPTPVTTAMEPRLTTAGISGFLVMGYHFSGPCTITQAIYVLLGHMVITRRRDDLCLPSAEDTDVTELYQDQMSKPLHHLTQLTEPLDLKNVPMASHDPEKSLLDSENSCNKTLQASHDPTLHDTVASHDIDTLMASLSLFDNTHLGRLGTAVSMETTSNYGNSLEASSNTELEQKTVAIPILPRGRQLTFTILSTWGDRHYVGLNGIEVFTDDGSPAMINAITADPPDINILPGYHSDPRVVTNLLDGVNMTRDDFHMWLTPFTPGKDHVIHITLNDVTTIAMIRIWNYNKSRIHSCRGAHHVIITLDNQVVFDGELARASGELSSESIDGYGDTILFTTDDEILLKIANYDQLFQQEQFNNSNINVEDETLRPSTAGVSDGSHDAEDTMETTNQIESSPLSPLLAHVLQLNLIATWGDLHYIGLTGIAVLGAGLEPLPLSADQLHANPCDLNDLPEYTDDDRTLDKLVDNINVTVRDSHMWLAPYTAGEDHVITITLKTPAMVTGLQIWNYNKSPEDTRRGVKEVVIAIDDNIISNGNSYWVFRQAPGNDHYDYGQMILFDTNNSGVIRLDNFITLPTNMTTVTMPTGFIYELQLLSTWGDAYYVGLNGLELYAEDGSQILLTANNIAAFPDSVNCLGGVLKDVRTPDKLIDGYHDTTEGTHMWLAPILPDIVNRVYIIFDSTVTLAAIKVWNYAKTPSRGVRELSVLVDGLLIYNGEVPMADTRPCLPTLTPCISAHVIFFGDHMIKSLSDMQDVQLTNDTHVIHSHTHHPHHSKLVADQALRPVTSLTATNSNRKMFSKR